MSKFMWQDDTIKKLSNEKRSYHTATLVGKLIYVWGGFETNWYYPPFMHTLDHEKLVWSKLSVKGGPPSPRSGHSATLVDDRIFIVGGVQAKRRISSCDIHTFDIACREWRSPPFSALSNLRLNVHSADYVEKLRSLVVFRGGDGMNYYNDLFILGIDSLVWKPLDARGKPPSIRANHATCAINDEIFIYGGCTATDFWNDLFILSFKTTIPFWTKPRVSGIPPAGRFGSTLTNIDGLFLLFGGSGEEGRMGDLHVFDPRNAKWEQVLFTKKEKNEFKRVCHVNRTPQLRSDHAAVCTGNKVFFVGGAGQPLQYLSSLLILERDK